MNRTAWNYYAGRYRGHRRRLVVVALVALAQFLLVLPTVFLVRHLFDTAIPRSDFGKLSLIGAALLGLNVANGVVSLWVRHVSLLVTKIVIREIRGQLLDCLYMFSRGFYDRSDRGKLHSVVVQDTERIDVMSNALIAQVLPSLPVCAALSLALLVLDWRLFLVLSSVTPLLYLVNRRIGKRLRLLYNAFRVCFESFSKGILFVLQTMDLARTQGAERQVTRRENRTLEELRVTSGSMALLDTAYGLMQSNLAFVSGILVLVVGGYSVASRRMTIGELLSFYVTLGLLGNYVRTIITSIPQIIMGNEALNAVHQLITETDRAPYSGSRVISLRGAVTFESVRFGYGDGLVLDGLDLEIPAGATVALMGANGSGKSTIAHLICGFYRPSGGRVRADGHPLEELDMAAMRGSLGVVMQNPDFFSGTILENLTFGIEDPEMGQVVAAATLATAHDFIATLPEGYTTPMGEEGVRLSGGQRQRIAIARALLRKPRLLILDEPTNHLDAPAVKRLMNNLSVMEHRPTIIVISHHQEIIEHCEMVYRLEGGRALLLQASPRQT